jgi:hypothetical protein
MAATQHAFPVFETLLAAKEVDLTTDTLEIGLIASTSPVFTWGATPETYTTLANFLAGDGTHGALTEVSTSGTGYSRLTLTSVTFTQSGENVTLSSANPSWSSATFSATYAFLIDITYEVSSSPVIIAYYDFGGTESCSSATFEIELSTGWCQWQYQ